MICPDEEVVGNNQRGAAVARTYTVVTGDTLSEIAQRFYASASVFPMIAAANGITNPDIIADGQVLVLPDLPRHVRVLVDAIEPLGRNRGTVSRVARRSGRR